MKMGFVTFCLTIFASTSLYADLVHVHYVGWDKVKRQEISGTITLDTQFIAPHEESNRKYDFSGKGIDQGMVSCCQNHQSVVSVMNDRQNIVA